MSIALALVLGAAGVSTPPQSPAERRLQVYKAVQEICIYSIVSNPKLATNLVVIETGPSKACECASMLTVSGMSDEDINALLERPDDDHDLKLNEHLLRCLQLSK